MRSVSFVFAASLMVLACSSDDDGGGTGTGGSGAGGSGTGGVGAFGASGGQAGSAGSATGGVGASGGAGGTAAAGGTGATDGGVGQDCVNCGSTQCKAENDACTASPDCNKLLTCANGCAGDGTCLQNCISNNPAGVQVFQGVIACLQSKCKVECGL